MSVLNADVSVSSWFLDTLVEDSSGAQTVRDARFSQTVQNPFVQQFQTSVFIPPNTTHFANTDVTFAWDPAGNVGSFDVTFDQRLGGPRALASTNANIWFVSTVDLFLDVSATMTFASSAADEADFLLRLSVADDSIPTGFFGALQVGGRFHFGQPASGTLGFAANDILLPANVLIRVSYSVRSLSPNAQFLNAPMTANGSIHFSFRPVPESTSLAMLSLCAVVLMRRRTARR